MNAEKSIIAEMELLVSQMTPVITITDNVIDGANWKLSMCKTYWIIDCMELTIGGKIFSVESFIANESIIVSGAAQPVGTTFQLKAPDFVHGNRRKVAGERNKEDDLTNVFVYLPRPTARENKQRDSDIAYTAVIKPIFLGPYVADRASTSDQQKDIIEPMNRMADLFEILIEDQDEVFNEPDTITREEWMNFGDPNIWGNEELIFNQKISGVELRLDVEVLRVDACECDGATIDVCPDVTTSFQDVDTEITTAPGQNIDFEVVNELDVPIGVLTENTPNKKKVQVAGGSPPLKFRAYTESLISYASFDDFYYNNLGYYDGGVLANHYTLSNDSLTPYSHLKRFTGEAGGYKDEVNGTFHSEDGTDVGTHAAAFPNGLIRDQLTGYEWYYLPVGARNWTTAIADIEALTFATHDDWIMPTNKDYVLIADYGLASPLNNGSHQLAGNLWSSTTDKSNTTKAWGMDAVGQMISAAKTGSKFRVLMRKF